MWRSVLSARVPDCQKMKKSGLDQYGPEHFEPLDITGHERVNVHPDTLQVISKTIFPTNLVVANKI